MFCAMFRKLLHPLGGDRLHICGKGGDEGDKYMLSHALEMLAEQARQRPPLRHAPFQSPPAL